MPRIVRLTWFRRTAAVAAAVGAILVLAALWVGGPLQSAFGLFAADPEEVRATLAGLGPLAPLASIGLNVMQGVVAPVPGFIVPFVNGVVFGSFWGAIVTWVGGIAAAGACFMIARTFGRSFAERLCRRSRTLTSANRTIERHGLPGVVIARLVPGMPFDVFSYMGGLTRLRPSTFLLGTAIGSLPHAVAYAMIGAHVAVPLWLGLAAMPVIGLLVAGVHRAVPRLRALAAALASDVRPSPDHRPAGRIGVPALALAVPYSVAIGGTIRPARTAR